MIKASRALLIILSGFGAYFGAGLSYDHLQHGEVCPMLGPVPACTIVFLGYFCVLIAAIFIKNKMAKPLFYLGWTPVFLLALVGASLELTKGETCPRALDVPQCFISLAMALTALGLFIYLRRSARN